MHRLATFLFLFYLLLTSSPVEAFLKNDHSYEIAIAQQEAFKAFQRQDYHTALEKASEALVWLEKFPESPGGAQLLGRENATGTIASLFKQLEVLYPEILVQYPEVYDEAKEKIAAIYSKLEKTQQSEMVPWLSSHASNLMIEGDYARAERLFLRALELGKGSSQERYMRPSIYTSLATLYSITGNYEKSERFYKQVIDEYTREQGANSTMVSSIENALAGMYMMKGDFLKALRLYDKIEENYRKNPPPAAETMFLLHQMRGTVYLRMKDYANAEKSFLKYLALIESYDPVEEEMKRMRESYARAASAYDPKQIESILKQYREQLQQNAPLRKYGMITGVLMNLGWVYLEQGNFQKAEKTFLDGIRIVKEKLKDPSYPQNAYGTFYTGLGAVYHRSGNYRKAEEYYHLGIGMWKSMMGEDSVFFTYYLDELAMLYAAMGETQKALQSFREIARIDNLILGNLYYIESERQKLAIAGMRTKGYEGALEFVREHLPKNPEALRFAYELVLNRKGLVLDIQAKQQEAFLQKLDKPTRKLWQKLTEARNVLGKLQQVPPEEAQSKDSKKNIARVQLKIDQLESKLANAQFIPKDKLQYHKATLKEVQERLLSGSLLIEIVKHKRYDWNKGFWTDDDVYGAFTLGARGPVSYYALGSAKEIGKTVQEVRKNIRGILSKGKSSEKNKILHENLRKAYKLVLEPMAKEFAGKDTLIICPEGDLNLLPFSALIDEKGNYLVESKVINLLTSSRDLIREETATTSGATLFLAANPAFNKTFGKPRKTGLIASTELPREVFLQFSPLPGTAREAELIPPLFIGERTVLTGSSATEEAVRGVQAPQVLHLATHGFFLSDEEGNGTTAVRGVAIRPKEAAASQRNPLLRSGLAFTGANHATEAEDNNDGLLTALEVTGMNLQGTMLVTLSACETGVGEIKSGEGVFGLRRAFTLAGAQNLLMTLWPISDDATVSLMEEFYRAYENNVTPARALQLAQRKTILKLKMKYGEASPVIWAPFILQGNPEEANE